MSQYWNEVKASSLPGVVLDCVVATGSKIGGGTPTDNTVALNKFLATSSASNPIHLILDGGTACKGLVLPSSPYVWISGIGWNSGIFMLAGSNADAINNGMVLPFSPGLPAPTQAGYVFVSDLMINGNRGNGANGNSTTGDPRGLSGYYWYSNVSLANLAAVRIENVYSYDSPAFNIRLDNCGDTVIVKNNILNPNVTSTGNQDGIHLDGPASDVYICRNIVNNNGSDDAIAINMAEGYSGPANRILIDSNNASGLHGLRIYGSGATSAIGDVIVSNNFFNAYDTGLLIGGGYTGPDTGGRTLVVDRNVFQLTSNGSGVTPIHMDDSVGVLAALNNTWLNPVGSGPFITGDTNAFVAILIVQNLTIYRTPSGNSNSVLLYAPSSGSQYRIGKFVIDGFQVIDQPLQSYGTISTLISLTALTTVGTIHVVSLDFTMFTTFVDTYTNITNIIGAFQPESNLLSKTGAYTTLPTDRTVLGDTTSAGFSIALPAKAYKGQKHTYKNIAAANTLTLTGTVDGSANPTLTTKAFMTIEYDGTNWQKVG